MPARVAVGRHRRCRHNRGAHKQHPEAEGGWFRFARELFLNANRAVPLHAGRVEPERYSTRPMFPLRKVPRIHGRRLRAVFRRSIELPVSVEGPRLRLVWDWPSGSRRAETSVSRTARFFAHARRSGPKSQRQRLRYQRRGRELVRRAVLNRRMRQSRQAGGNCRATSAAHAGREYRVTTAQVHVMRRPYWADY